jgi:hypothetical protein
MAFLTIAGITVPVQESGSSENIDQYGTSEPAYAGNRRSAIRAEKRRWQFTTGLMLQADANTLRAAIALRAQVACAGDALNGASTTCEVEVRDIPFVALNSSDGKGFLRQLGLTLYEV